MPAIPLQTKFLNMRRVVSLEREIVARVEELGALHGRVVGCHVSVELPHKHHHNGNAVEVRISLALPGELVVTRKSSPAAAPATAVHQAFDALKRQLRKKTGKKLAQRGRSRIDRT